MSKLQIIRYLLPPFLIFGIIIILIYFSISEKIYNEIFTIASILSIIAILCYFLLIFTLGQFIKNDLSAIFLNTGLAISFVGAITRIMRWPGGKENIYFGLFLILLSTIILFINRTK